MELGNLNAFPLEILELIVTKVAANHIQDIRQVSSTLRDVFDRCNTTLSLYDLSVNTVITPEQNATLQEQSELIISRTPLLKNLSIPVHRFIKLDVLQILRMCGNQLNSLSLTTLVRYIQPATVAAVEGLYLFPPRPPLSTVDCHSDSDLHQMFAMLPNLYHLNLDRCLQTAYAQTNYNLSFSALTNLRSLNLSNNHLKSRDITPSSLSTLVNLRTLILNHNRFHINLNELMEPLSCLTELRKLDLGDNVLGVQLEFLHRKENVNRLVSGLVPLQKLEYLNLNNNWLDNYDMLNLTRVLREKTNLQTLLLGENYLKIEILEYLQNLTQLHTLDLFTYSMHHSRHHYCFNELYFLTSFKCLKSLKLNNIDLSDPPSFIHNMCSILCYLPRLSSLTLWNTWLNDVSVRILIGTLNTRTSLQKLDLSNNCIGDLGLSILSEFTSNNKMVKLLTKNQKERVPYHHLLN